MKCNALQVDSVKIQIHKAEFSYARPDQFWAVKWNLKTLLCTVDENITQNIHIFDLLVSSVYY